MFETYFMDFARIGCKMGPVERVGEVDGGQRNTTKIVPKNAFK